MEHEPFITSKNGDPSIEEARPRSPAPRRRQSRKSKLEPRISPIVLAASIGAIASSLLTLVAHILYLRVFAGSSSSLPFALPGLNISTLGPIASVFHDETVYLNRSTEAARLASEAAWKSLIPTGRGFISTAKLLAANHPLPPSVLAMDTDHAGQFAISAFHQLHCLHMLVKSYDAALDHHDHDVVHARHCLEYIRSSIVCAADSALEPWKPDLNGVDGFGSVHMCRDFRGLFRWAEKYWFSDIEP
ncbi:hypothetical protein TWF696_000676 [Orbilia brochopaga]|uniref:Uncharacterized protein n=1 Tax=Orbilia brochopaga TaxID=3140254 RepID=A0AAV9VC10_9PEZI